MAPSLWLIAGPTASGKSALALRLARALGGEVVNADSMQLYADLPILIAAPDAAARASAPHHLYGVADAGEAWSVGRWLRATQSVLAQLAARARPAIVTGGTGLYFRALTQGLAETPAIPPAVRADVERLYEQQGEAEVRARLAALDPQAQDRIAPGDRQRLVRALSVAQATGVALSAWQARTRPPVPASAWRAVVLEPPRAELYARCDARLQAMLAAGALDEVARLKSRRLDPGLPAMKALGVRAFSAHLDGETTLAAALASAQQETRHYAKRQSTWFRGQTPDWPRIAAPEPPAQWAALEALVQADA